MNIFDLMAAPFAECMVLVGIHTYLGIHVLRRRVIFVDLALAQIAALGTTVGFFFGILPETTAALVFSMMFTFVGAGVFAVTRIKGERVPQEAVIGLAYAISAAMAVLVVEKTHGAEHLKDILVGSLLWVSWSDVGVAAVAYAVIGAIHYLLRDKFILISEDPEEAYRRGLNVRAWDFLFYVSFGFVITFSVRVAGVLLVFVFLVAPAIMAFLVTSRLKTQLLIGWAMGTVVTVAGLFLSYDQDLPSGPAVVACYGIALVLGAILTYLVRAADRGRAVRFVGIGSVIALATVGVLYGSATLLATTSLANSDVVAHTEADLKRDADAVAAREHHPTSVFVGLGDRCIEPGIQQHYTSLGDADARLAFAQETLPQKRRRALKILVLLLADEKTPPFYRSEAVDLLRLGFGRDFGLDPDLPPAACSEGLHDLCTYLRAEGNFGPAREPPSLR